MGKKGLFFLSGFMMDLRSLAIFRIAFGLCLCLDVFYRMFYVNVFYTDSGVMPRDALIEKFLNQWEWSLFLANGQTPLVLAMMGTLLLFAISFTLGFYTRLSAFVCWVLLVSMHVRNQVILHGGDDVFRTMLFWCQFAPLAAEYSLDRILNPQFKPASKTVLSFGAAGLMMQLLSIYIFTSLLKWDPIWWTKGTAVYYALSLDQFTRSFGQWLLNFPGFMKIMTYATVVVELVGPILVILPFAFLRRRVLVAAAFIGFHFSLFLTMVLGLFPWVCMSAWLMVLPSEFWDKLPPLKMKWMEKLAQWLKPYFGSGKAPQVQFGKINQTIAAVFLFLMLVWNITQLDFLHLERTSGFRKVMNVAELYQRWSMFAPYPRKDDGWYVVEANLFNGEKINPLRGDDGEPVSFEKPDDVAGTFKNSMWRKYLTNIWLKSNSKYRIYLGRYLCRSWNAQHKELDARINTIYIYYMMEMTPPPGVMPLPVDKQLTWRHYCFDKPEDWDKN